MNFEAEQADRRERRKRIDMREIGWRGGEMRMNGAI